MSQHTAARAFLGMSHSPLIGLNPLPDDVERTLRDAIDKARAQVTQWRPELVVLIGPDHYNGFFNELMPPFCIGSQATSVGDYLTPAGPLHVAEDTALALAHHLMDEGFDPAVSRRMEVDHGLVQPLQFLWGGLDTPPLVPVFMNAVAMPTVPRLARCLAFGRALGRFLDTLPQRTLVIGSGGLSHEPPVPTMAHPDPAVRERIIVRQRATDAEREAKTQRVMAAGREFAAGTNAIKPLNTEWDRRWMDALARGAVAELTTLSEDSIGQDAGLSAHESKTWLIARGAMPDAPLHVALQHHQAIPELIAGYGLLFMHT